MTSIIVASSGKFGLDYGAAIDLGTFESAPVTRSIVRILVPPGEAGLVPAKLGE